MDNHELDSAHAAHSNDATEAERWPATPADTSDTEAFSAAAPRASADSSDESDGGDGGDGTETLADPTVATAARKRRRGSRGGRNRKKPRPAGEPGADLDDDEFDDDLDDDDTNDDTNDDTIDDTNDDTDSEDVGSSDRIDGAVASAPAKKAPARRRPVVAEAAAAQDVEMPERMSEGRPSPEAAEKALVRRPQIGDTRPSTAAPAIAPPGPASGASQPVAKGGQRAKSPKSGAPGPKSNGNADQRGNDSVGADQSADTEAAKKKRRRGGKGRGTGGGSQGGRSESLPELDADVLERRRGRERNGRPIGRYLMCVQVRPNLTQVAVLEGRTLIEHYVSRPADDVSQIHGNIYVGKVQNVLPGMEAAFVDISTPKNAVLYRGDVQYDQEDIVQKHDQPRIEQMLKSKQLIVCQVTKNPIGAKGARLTQEVSLPGRFVVLIPNSKTYGISKRLPDDVRKRLRNILDRVKPAEHGLIVRTAAEHATEHELRADMTRLLDQWNIIEAKAKKAGGPALLYREPELAVRVIREEFNSEYRGIVIDDQRLFDDVHDYVNAFNPELADRVERYDADEEGLPIFERFHIHEQLHKALDRKVWLPSGGSLIIEHTEALTVIDVNTGKNVGTSNLEETVYRNNLEAAEEVAKQLRLRDIGGIVVIDFIDMEIRENRRKVVDAFRSALARDKTRTQVFDITELGLVEMTRKRIGEGLLVNFADQCPNCEGRGVVIDAASLE
jgi:ribonuclease E